MMNEDQAADLAMSIESTLSVYQLFVLLEEGQAASEPIWSLALIEPEPGISAAPLLDEETLTKLTQIREMERLGLVSLGSYMEAPYWNLTAAGLAVRNWWVEALKEHTQP